MSNKMTQLSSQGERLILFRKEKGYSQQSLADSLGISRSYVADIEKGRSEPSSNLLMSLTTILDVSADWLLTGEGNMLKSAGRADIAYAQSIPAQYQDQEQGSNSRVAPKSWEDFALVPFYNVEASAGLGAVVDQEQITGEMAFRQDWLRNMGLQQANCALIKARGDSMEETIHDGDLLLVDTRIDAIEDDAIYIIQLDHVLIVKRVQHALDGSLIIISDNEKYQNQTISQEMAQKLAVVGRVRWYGHEL